MLFANIEMFIAINKFVSDLFIAINKFYKLFLFMVFVRRNDLWQDKMVAIRSLSGETTYGRRKWLQYGLCPEKVGFHRTKRCLKVGGLQAVPKGCAIGNHKRRPPVCHQEQRQPYARRAVA